MWEYIDALLKTWALVSVLSQLNHSTKLVHLAPSVENQCTSFPPAATSPPIFLWPPVFPVHCYSSFKFFCVCKQAMPSLTDAGDLPRDNLWVAFSSPSLGCAGQHLQCLQPALLCQPPPKGSCRQGSRLLCSSNYLGNWFGTQTYWSRNHDYVRWLLLLSCK